jgi:hypothetical protein
VDSNGRVVDFHAVRVTYVTMLVRSGASVKEAQELARQSTPTLTMGVYTKLGVHDLSGALSRFPSLTGGEAASPQRMKATGTDDARGAESGPPGARQKCRQNPRGTAQPGATPRTIAGAGPVPTGAHKSLSHAGQREITGGSATCCKTATGRIRTDDLRFTNQSIGL